MADGSAAAQDGADVDALWGFLMHGEGSWVTGVHIDVGWHLARDCQPGSPEIARTHCYTCYTCAGLVITINAEAELMKMS